MNKKKKKGRRIRALLIILCLVAAAVYGGVKAGEYLAYKLTKPIGESENPLEGVKGNGETGGDIALSENDAISLTGTVTEFVNAEHMKKTDKLAGIVSPDYYNTLIKNIKPLKASTPKVQDINFKDVAKKKVIVEVTYIKNSRQSSETITLELSGSSWKVSSVERG
ncbi:MAG TPA: hypothetical protein DD429_12915 [Clostridiaceae bacterium]|nr:hypothetical protein [Clostridiaceae bacterium]